VVSRAKILWAARRIRAAVVCSLVVVLGALAFSVTSAAALTGHRFLSHLTEAPPGTPFTEPTSLAVNQATGDTFVADGAAVDEFSSGGEYKTRFGEHVITPGSLHNVAVDKTTGFVYVADLESDVIDVFKPDGSGGFKLIAQWIGLTSTSLFFTEITGVAVDSSAGLVYASDGGQGVVDVFKANATGAEEFTSTLKGGALESPHALATSEKTGQVYVVDGAAVKIYAATGKFEHKVTGAGTPSKEVGEFIGVAVEEATGDLYASALLGGVFQFDATGHWIGEDRSTATNSLIGEPVGIAISPSGDLNIADATGRAVDVFGPNEAVPGVKTNAAAKIERTSAVLKGFVKPEGAAGAAYHFEYGRQTAVSKSGVYEFQTVSTPAAAEGAVEAKIEHLEAGAAYSYRLVGENEHKVAANGLNREFETPVPVSAVTTAPASNVEATSATVHGSLEPEGLETKYRFEYGETKSYGKTSPVPEGETSSTTTANVETHLSGLRSNTTYHYRLAASNKFGTAFGADATFTTLGPPSIASEPATGIGHTSATLNATINPNKLATKYHIEYGETTSYGNTTPEGEIPAPGEKAEKITAALTGLNRATTYHFRVVASNAAGIVDGPDQEFTTVLIESESATEVTGENAKLHAELNPLGSDTKYHFEYGETTSYGSSVPELEADIGSESGEHAVAEYVSGLHPDTTYHYRVVANVEGVAVGGPDRTFTTSAVGASFKLPDGRAYELVSPPDKHGGVIQPLTTYGAIQASDGGEAFAFVVDGPIVEEAEGNRSPEAQQILATRAEHGGWTSQEIATPHGTAYGLRPGKSAEYQVFSSNLALSVVQPFPFGLTALAEPPLSPPQSEAERGHQEKTIYVRNDAPLSPSGSETAIYEQAAANGKVLAVEHHEAQAKPGYVPLVTAHNTKEGAKFGGVGVGNRFQPGLLFMDSTPDLTHVLLKSEQTALTSESEGPGLYEWANGELHLVSVLPGGAPAEGGDVAVGFGFRGNSHEASDVRHAISSDGSRVIWTYLTGEEQEHRVPQEAVGHLYLRDMARGETIQLDAGTGGSHQSEVGAAQFQGASKDDSRIFFTDTRQLTPDSTAVQFNIETHTEAQPDLYECEVVTEAGKLVCRLKDLTADSNANEHANVQGTVLGESEDGSYVYFVAKGVLASGARAGEDNLYLLHFDGTEWSTTYIRTLSPEDGPDWSANRKVVGVGAESLMNLTARVSPNGEHLAFMSNRRLTGYNNTDVNEPEVEVEKVKKKVQHADEEVFLYSTTSGVTCVSCNPSGARPTGVFDTASAGEGVDLVVDQPVTWLGGEGANVDPWLAGNIPGWNALQQETAVYQSHYLSDSGRLFFNSADALVPEVKVRTRTEAIPGNPTASVGVENVYEYEPNGVGACTKSAGCIALISSGTSEKESAFLDASASGNDVFILTAAPLVPQDVDTAYDVYDAHVCTESSPCLTSSSGQSEECKTSSECKPGSFPPPTFQAPPTTASGAGNVTPHSGVLPSKGASKPTLTQAQKLSRALARCRKLPRRTRAQRKARSTCEARARKLYGAKRPASRGTNASARRPVR
jgi:phosphodiesterase/alkaline phosphatase D-like protein